MYELRNVFKHLLELPLLLAVWVILVTIGAITSLVETIWITATDPSVPVITAMCGTVFVVIFGALAFEAITEASRYLDNEHF